MRLQSTTAPSRTFTSLLFVIAAFFAFIASFALSGSSAPAGETAESSTPLPGAAQSMPAVGVTVEENHAWDISWRDKVVALEVKGAIVGKPFSDMSDRLTAALDKADQDGAHLVVIEMDSPGGEVGACDKLSKRIFESKTPVVAVVVHKAVSGGAMLASAAREIVMTKSGRIGDIQPMQASITGGGAGMDDRTAEKIEVDIRTIMKVYAEHYGRPVPVVEAMVSRSASLYQVLFDEDSRVFLPGHELEVLEEN
ncbi:MAG: ATP-dependent Clp protease proteolytic subunit, partial [Planctomycetes bacterium]|nr:ATP-dependent Clp protease proteolytic subunit [Planctomycetota bacterium]